MEHEIVSLKKKIKKLEKNFDDLGLNYCPKCDSYQKEFDPNNKILIGHMIVKSNQHTLNNFIIIGMCVAFIKGGT